MAIATQIITDPQQIFDHVVEHLLKQGGPARHPEYGCYYRVSEGAERKACAFGCLIPDDLYDARWEGTKASALIASEPALGAWNNPVNKPLIQALQMAHDGAPTTEDGHWSKHGDRPIRDRLYDISDIFSLDCSSACTL